jgi:hypothetical protein
MKPYIAQTIPIYVLFIFFVAKFEIFCAKCLPMFACTHFQFEYSPRVYGLLIPQVPCFFIFLL